MRRSFDLRLIVVTDRRLASPRTVEEVVRAALEAGAPAVQLRDKAAPPRALLEQARALLPIVHAAGALLFVNDRIDVALAAGADGVHLGPDDLPVAAARHLAGPEFLIGYSTDSPDLARRAQADGASYIGCGAVFGTATKKEAAGENIGPDRLAQVVDAVAIPVVGIGGITPENIGAVAGSGAAGVAVVSAIMAAPDPQSAAGALLRGAG